jgi:DNA-binding HxlR family transcriptional regulator
MIFLLAIRKSKSYLLAKGKLMGPRERKSDCPIHAALTVFGDAWTLIVVRDLFRGRNTFSELANGKERIATNVLADRLARLEEDGIISKEHLQGRGNPTRYELTEKGLDLLPILISVADWSLKHNPHSPEIRALVPTRRRELTEGAEEIRARLRDQKPKESP